jgi:hypothetical protein
MGFPIFLAKKWGIRGCGTIDFLAGQRLLRCCCLVAAGVYTPEAF